MKVVAILQARSSSSRLPNKVLLPILGVPMLEHQISRVTQSKQIDQLIVATSVEKSDDEIEHLCNKINVKCFRGSLNDVLDRFYQAANEVRADHVVRLTGDCPLADPEVIDDVILKHINEEADYTSNCCPPTFPDGLDVEVLKYSSLEISWRDACLSSQREHVTSYVREKSGFKLSNYENDIDLSTLRWTVDEINDYFFVIKIYEELYQKNPMFGTSEILKLLEENPKYSTMNSSLNRNEGLLKSLQNDKLFIDRDC